MRIDAETAVDLTAVRLGDPRDLYSKVMDYPSYGPPLPLVDVLAEQRVTGTGRKKPDRDTHSPQRRRNQ